MSDLARRYATAGLALTTVEGKRALRRRWQETKAAHPDFVAGLLAGHLAGGGGLAAVLGGCAPALAVTDLDTTQARDGLLDLLDGDVPPTAMARTPRGLHLFWRDPGGLRSQVAEDGHDLKVGAAYVVLPNGRAPGRAWLAGHAPWEVKPASMPTGLLAFYAERQAGLERPADHPATRPHAARFGRGAIGTRYGLAALESELDRLLAARHPGRNHALFKAAANLEELVLGGHLERGAVERALRIAADEIYGAGPPPEPGEVDATIASGMDPAKRRARGASGATAA